MATGIIVADVSESGNGDNSLNSRFLGGIVAVVILGAHISAACAGGPYSGKPAAPLDVSLMAFKEQGVWYDLCEAPAFHVRIPPHYATYGPPPVPCCPPPAFGPVGPLIKVK